MNQTQSAAVGESGFALEDAIDQLARIRVLHHSRPHRLVIKKFNPGGMVGHGSTEVARIDAGFDWTAGRVIITPAKPLTELTPEQVDAIEKSVRAGGSWHAYEAQKKLRERIRALEAQITALKAGAADAAGRVCLAVAELPDRNSPEGWPEAMLVTHEELRAIVVAEVGQLIQGAEGGSEVAHG